MAKDYFKLTIKSMIRKKDYDRALIELTYNGYSIADAQNYIKDLEYQIENEED